MPPEGQDTLVDEKLGSDHEPACDGTDQPQREGTKKDSPDPFRFIGETYPRLMNLVYNHKRDGKGDEVDGILEKGTNRTVTPNEEKYRIVDCTEMMIEFAEAEVVSYQIQRQRNRSVDNKPSPRSGNNKKDAPSGKAFLMDIAWDEKEQRWVAEL